MAQLRCLKKHMVESYQLSGYFWYIAQNIEGLGVLESKFFEQRADEELGHSKRVAFRLMQLGETPTDDPAQWEQDSGMGKLSLQGFLPSEVHLKEH